MIKRTFNFLPIIVLLVLTITPDITQAKSRALWVTRWDFKTADDIKQIFQNCKQIGCNEIFFQVRGNATVFYPSTIEPWAWELTGETAASMGTDPGWDPLACAIQEGQRLGLEVHAWMNALPGWRGIIPAPKGSNHPWVKHRSWFMIDHRGTLMRPSKAFYTFLSPGQPAVRQYLGSLFKEVAINYPQLNGIHLDYIRYPGNKELGTYRNFSFDKISVAAFKKQYGKNPTHTMPEWSRFKCDQVTETLKTIRSAIRSSSETMELSATCFANIHSATSEKGQNPREWIEQNLVDWVTPMAYYKSVDDLKKSLDEFTSFFDPSMQKKLVIGLYAEESFNKTKMVRDQLDYVSSQAYGGSVLFAYSSLFTNHKPKAKAKAVQTLWMEQQIQDLLMSAY